MYTVYDNSLANAKSTESDPEEIGIASSKDEQTTLVRQENVTEISNEYGMIKETGYCNVQL